MADDRFDRREHPCGCRTQVRVYLDVDGVFNAVTDRDPEAGWSCYERKMVGHWPITFAPEFVDVINDLARTPGVAMHWLTTWCHEAPQELAPALGIDGRDWPVVGFEHWRQSRPRWLAVVRGVHGRGSTRVGRGPMTAISCRHVRPALGDLLPERCALTWGHDGWHRARTTPEGTGASWPSDEVGQQPPTWKPFVLDVA